MRWQVGVDRFVKFNIGGLGFLSFVNVFGGCSINEYHGCLWRWLEFRVFVRGCWWSSLLWIRWWEEFFFWVTLTKGCGSGCFSTSLESKQIKGWQLKNDPLGIVRNVVKTTPPTYMRIIVWKEVITYPLADAITVNASNITCISCDVSWF